ncbi:MAG: SPFH domain-containing protein [Sandaracinaceae bacterium]
MNRSLRIAPMLLLLWGCTNQTTPEGHEGYITHEPLVAGQAHYVGSQTGPTSTGLVWRQYLTNVDMRPKTYTEQFRILSRDNLNVGFEAHLRISLRAGTVRRVVEELGADIEQAPQAALPEGETRHPEWYIRNVRQPCRTAVRDTVHGFDAYDIQSRTQEISGTILARLQEEWADSPVVFEAISIGNLTYPEEINREIQRKLAAEQDLERMTRERQIAEQQARIMVTTARGRAAAQRIVNDTLTPLYVQHEMLEQFRALSRSPRATIVVTPTSPTGSSPVIMNLASP